jgi:hypothetical protein
MTYHVLRTSKVYDIFIEAMLIIIETQCLTLLIYVTNLLSLIV